MSDSQVKELCLSIMKADTEDEVVALLKDAGYWDKHSYWRFYGDYENNFNTIGNQQSRPDSALVEKLVNSVDARLMNECLVRGIDPEGSSAPQTIRHAVAEFFDDSINPTGSTAGRISEWPDSKRTAVARGITLVTTGASPRDGRPCFTISDCGEGQTPKMMPVTLLSLTRSNKLRIPFVQGKFNMGGTGVLKFCGHHNLQLIVSRRNPQISNGKLADPSDKQWGITVVRREDPEDGRRSSVYTYLAPVGSDAMPGKGSVLSFSAAKMPIFPEGREPYSKDAAWGTLIKLYEYSASGYSNTHILRKDGILGRLDLLLSDVALPIRLHECRPSFKGHEGSFETTLTGLRVRLDDDKGQNLEPEFPASSPLSAAGEQMTATIYAFKKDKAETYRKNEGIIFTLNGQTHGHLTKDFFTRKGAGSLNYIADSILVIVDCSKFSGRAREDLFMNSRDRLSGGELRGEIEHALEDLLKNQAGLRALRERRRREEIESKLDDSKPLEEILESLLKQSPTLSALFLQGRRLTNPFKTIKAQSKEEPFRGHRYPTYFKFKDKDYGIELQRECPSNKHFRITFETDVVNDYFDRKIDPGEFTLFNVAGNSRVAVATYVGPNLHNGIATLTVQLPADSNVGDVLRFVTTVNDPSRVDPFENVFVVSVKRPVDAHDHDEDDDKKRRKPPIKEEGMDREIPSGISLPKIIEVNETEWELKSPPFDQYTALRIKNAGTVEEDAENGNAPDVYDFFVNMDNICLKSELKSSGLEPELVRARWKYGLVLLGLALLHEYAQSSKVKGGDDQIGLENDHDENNIEERVEYFSRAIAPVLLPIINSLGDLDLEATLAIDGSGEAT
jgi:hypothetical protein